MEARGLNALPPIRVPDGPDFEVEVEELVDAEMPRGEVGEGDLRSKVCDEGGRVEAFDDLVLGPLLEDEEEGARDLNALSPTFFPDMPDLGFRVAELGEAGVARGDDNKPVSYTHLTLPTIYSV